MIYGLAAIPVLTAAGSAIDMSRALVVRSRLAQALDAAGLAVGSAVGLTQAQMTDIAQKYFDANYPTDEIGVPSQLQIHFVSDSKIELSATATLPTTLMAIVGINQMDVGVSSEITRESKALEAVMVLDTTGSMGNAGKIEALRQAATDLVTILFGDVENPPKLKVGMVPFAASVRLDPDMAVANGWVDTAGASTWAQANFSGGRHPYWMYTNAQGLANTPWRGCVEARPNGLDETDDPPTSANTRWVPFFAPDEPQIGEPENNALNPEAPNQGGITSNFSHDYINVNARVATRSISLSSTNVNTSSDRIRLNGHGFSTGEGAYRFYTTNTMPGGLTAGTNYWIIRYDNNWFRLATSYANAMAGTYVNITSTGSGSIAFPRINPASDSFYDASHGMETGNGPVRMITRGAAQLPGGVVAGTDYWFIRIDDNTFNLAASYEDAVAGIAVDVTSTGMVDSTSNDRFYTAESNGGTSLADQLIRQNDWRKYRGRTYGGTSGPHRECGMQPVTPLTNSRSTILNAIPNLNAEGYTHIPFGLVWGWRVLSPTEPFTQGVAYDDPETIKALILMTDGDNTMPGENSTLNGSLYTAYGYARQERLGAGIDTTGEIEAEQDAKTARVCATIKAAGVRVYTIALMVNTNSTINMLRTCATEPALFFNTPSAAELRATFQNIAQDLSNLRVSK